MKPTPWVGKEPPRVAAIAVDHGKECCVDLVRRVRTFGLPVLAVWNVAPHPDLAGIAAEVEVPRLLGEEYEEHPVERWRCMFIEKENPFRSLAELVRELASTQVFVFVGEAVRNVARSQSAHFVYWQLKSLFDLHGIDHVELLQEPNDFQLGADDERLHISLRCGSAAACELDPRFYRSFSLHSTLSFLRVVARDARPEIWLEGVWLEAGEHLPSRRPEDAHWKAELLACLSGDSALPPAPTTFSDAYRYTELLWIPSLGEWVAFHMHNAPYGMKDQRERLYGASPVEFELTGPFACADEPPPKRSEPITRRRYVLAGDWKAGSIPHGRFYQLFWYHSSK